MFAPDLLKDMKSTKKKLIEKFKKIKLLVLDFDGVLTDGLVYVDQDGYEMVRCSRRDSMGTNLLQKAGVKVFVVSKEKNRVVGVRAKKMGIDHIQSVDDKVTVLKKLSKKLGINPTDICYVGDDLNDFEVMKLTGVSVAVADADDKIKNIASYITIKKGGQGAVREVCDMIINSKE